MVTIHHKMSRKVPDFHVHLFKFSECSFDAIYIGETHFQIRALMAELATLFFLLWRYYIEQFTKNML